MYRTYSMNLWQRGAHPPSQDSPARDCTCKYSSPAIYHWPVCTQENVNCIENAFQGRLGQPDAHSPCQDQSICGCIGTDSSPVIRHGPGYTPESLNSVPYSVYCINFVANVLGVQRQCQARISQPAEHCMECPKT